MDRVARVQTGAGIGTIVALPLVYIGGTNGSTILTVIGFVIFTIGMVAVPLMRFLPARNTETTSPPTRE